MHTIFLFDSIDPFLKITTALESHDLPWCQHQIFTSSWVPSPALTFLMNTELTEPTDKYILTVYQFGLDEFNEVLHYFSGLVSGKPDLCLYSFNDVCFC